MSNPEIDRHEAQAGSGTIPALMVWGPLVWVGCSREAARWGGGGHTALPADPATVRAPPGPSRAHALDDPQAGVCTLSSLPHSCIDPLRLSG